MTDTPRPSPLANFEHQLFTRLDTIAEELRVLQQLLQDQTTAPEAVEAVATVEGHHTTSKKDRASDEMVDRKGPEMLRLLLRGGFKTTGMRSPDLSAQLGISKDSVRRLADRLSALGLVRSIPNSGTGGRGTLIRVVNGKAGEVERWIEAKTMNGVSEVHDE